MPDNVPHIDPATIGALIEGNINAYLLSFAGLPGAVLHDDAQCTWVDSGVASSTFNSVVRAQFSPDDVEPGIKFVLSHFRRRAMPVTWHIGPTSEPVDLGRRLLAHGMTHSEDEPGMAIEIDEVQEDFVTPPGLVVEPVRTARDLEDWVAVWLFPLPEAVRQRYFDALLARGIGDELRWHLYVGRLGGKPVATSELFTGEGVAAVHYVITVPEARRRGIGRAMTLRVLHEARDRGYSIAVLTASPDGIGIYRRLGFREYCWFRRYQWEPS